MTYALVAVAILTVMATVAANDSTAAGQIALAVVVVLTSIFHFLNSVMDRRRLEKKEDAIEARLLEAAKALAEETNKKASGLAAQTNAARVELSRQIEENTQISREAFREANNVNGKLAEMNRTAVAVAAATTTTGAPKEELLTVAKDIDEQLHVLKHAVLNEANAAGLLKQVQDKTQGRIAKATEDTAENTRVLKAAEGSTS